MTHLPRLSPQDDTVVLVKFLDTNPDSYNLIQQMKSFDMLSSAHLHKNGPDEGVIIVMDLKGLVFGHFLKANVVVIKKFLYYLQVRGVAQLNM